MTATTTNLTSEECEDAALEIFSEAVKEGKWLIAVFRVEDEKDSILLRRVTCNFPDGFFIQCINMLKESLLEELNQKLSVKPLPLAPHLLMRNENGEEIRIEPNTVLHEGNIPSNTDTHIVGHNEIVEEQRKDKEERDEKMRNRYKEYRDKEIESFNNLGKPSEMIPKKEEHNEENN